MKSVGWTPEAHTLYRIFVKNGHMFKGKRGKNTEATGGVTFAEEKHCAYKKSRSTVKAG
jgi:hypothetical protein